MGSWIGFVASHWEPNTSRSGCQSGEGEWGTSFSSKKQESLTWRRDNVGIGELSSSSGMTVSRNMTGLLRNGWGSPNQYKWEDFTGLQLSQSNLIQWAPRFWRSSHRTCPVSVWMQVYVRKMTRVFIKPRICLKASHLPQALPFTECLVNAKYCPSN